MSTPYFDRVLSKSETSKLLTQLKATVAPGRSKPGIIVYTLSGQGEAMVEKSGDTFRVRLFKGQCAC